MNPPFSKQQDMVHVTHAFDFLRPGGRLVAIMAPSWQYRASKTAQAFRELHEAVGWSVEALPDSSFKSAGTNVRSVIVVLDRAVV